MDQKILIGGAVAVGAYFWWASRSSNATTAPVVTRTPSTSAMGLGFDTLFGAQKPASVIVTKQPDQIASNTAPSTAPPATGPAPATKVGFGPGEVPGYKAPPDSGYKGALGIAINDPVAVDRFDSVKAYVNTLDWSADNKAASASALASAANQYGVSQREIAIATGYKDADIANLLAGQNVARY